jgi:midasin
MTAKLSHLKALENITARIRHCASSGTLYGVRNLLDSLVEAELTICRIQEALKETEEAIRRHRELQGIQIKANDLTALHNARSEIALLIGALSQVCSAARSSGCGIFTQSEFSGCQCPHWLTPTDDFELLSTVAAFRRRLHDALEAQATTSPELSYLLLPVAAMTEMSSSEVATSRSELSPDLWVKSDNLIQVMLVVIQGLAQTSLVNNVDEDVGVHVPSAYSQLRTFAQSLRIPDIVAELSSFLAGLSDYLAQFGHSADAPLCLARILPFVESLSETYAQSVATHIFIVKSTYKLCYVVGRLMLDLAHRGFCKPSEESDSGKDGDEGDKVEGTGMGAGSGDKNVSSEIEEEGQVEGLQGEKEEEGEADEKEDGVDDDAVEMENDFEGALGDGKEREGEDDEGEDEGEEDEHDDHIGDVDPLDPGAVDEKFWGDEEQPEKENGKELMDQGTHEAPGEAEMSAKENERKESKNDKREQEAAEGSEQQQDDTQHDDTPQDELGDDDGEDMPDDSNDRDDNDADEHPARQDQSEVNVPEGDRLDLPEDLYLGSENGNDLDDDLEDDMDLPNDETGEGDDAEGMQDVDMGSEKGGEAAEDAPPATDVTEEGSAEQEDLSQNLDLSASNDAQAQESADVGQGQSGSTEKSDQRPMPENDDVPMDEAEKLVQDNQPQGEGYVAHLLFHTASYSPRSAAPNQPQQGSSVEQPEGDGPVDSSGAPIPSAAESQPQASRSLGDILQEIRRRRDEIFAQQEREQPTQDRSQAQAEASGQVEYLQDDDQDEDMQALGPAGDEERQKLEDLNIVDDDAEADTQAEHSMHDADQAERPSTAQNQKPHDIAQQEVPRDAQGAEKALTQAEVQGQHSGPSAPEHMEIDGVEEGFEVKEEIKVEAEESDAELHVVDQPLDALTKGKGEDQWRQYASLTSDLSYALCEQLRLILEPTLATRLQGDFRTGKRLNMRKIIPYIASEYTKDKIWLRRTKPSRREYQVLLSLDDSRSMAESHSVNLAYQTLALVAQALNKLEVGQVSIAKFGESVDILHPFGDAGFTDADGAKVMSSFTFDQQCTNVAALVERTLTFLAEARQKQSSSTTAPDMWQLQIIISDGVCQDHHKLRTLLRRALEERVMIVFIIVDSLHQNTPSSSTDPASTRPSILSMQTVEYKHVHGTMQLEMTRYLDTFPFEFFVVLRDVEALPGVLADTLRQWMARVSQSQE